MRRRPWCVVTALQLGLSACTGELAAPHGTPHEAAPRAGGTLHLASTQDVRSLDPTTSVDTLSRQAELLLFAGLVTFDDDADIIPDLADSWEASHGGTDFLFHLRPRVLFHDGTELEAADVKRSIERALHPKTANAFASRFDALLGYEAYSKAQAAGVSGIVAEGRYDVRFRLSHPDTAFLSALALVAARPVCKSGGATYDDSWVPCGAGPFRLPKGGWARGTSLRLERFGEYNGPRRVWLDAVQWTFNVSLLAERFKFERGEIDVIEELSQADVSRFRADPRWTALGEAGAEAGLHGLSMNTELPPFDNVEMRRAVAAAIDRTALCLLKPANLSPVTQPMIRGVKGFERAPSGQSYDYHAALEHMRRAGYPYDPATGRGGYPRPVELVVPARSLEESLAQIEAQQLAKIGIRVQILPLNFAAFSARTHRRREVAMSAQGWDLDTADPSGVFDPLFGSAAIADGDTSNTAFYSNRVLDELIDRGHSEMNPEQRLRLYLNASKIVSDEAPWAFVFSWHWYVVHQPRVHGLHVHPVWQTDVTGVWVDGPPGEAP